MRRLTWRTASSLIALCTAGGLVAAVGSSAAADAGHRGGRPARHVLLLSVDGLHQSDLAWYTAHYPQSTLAGLVRGGVAYASWA